MNRVAYTLLRALGVAIPAGLAAAALPEPPGLPSLLAAAAASVALGAAAEARLHHRERRLCSALGSVAAPLHALGTPVDEEGLCDGILAAARALTGCESAGIWIGDAAGGLTLRAGWGAATALARQRDVLTRAPGTGVALRDRGRACRVGVAPVTGRSGWMGYLTLELPPRHRLEAAQKQLLQLLGIHAGVGLENSRAWQRLQSQAHTDPLTGVGSRRFFEEQLRREQARAGRTMTPLALAMIDVDGMKELNDRHGHPVGDRVLQAVGSLLAEVREGDLAARYGGDEFVILMPETTRREAEHVVGRLRESLAALNAGGAFPFPIALSVGIHQASFAGDDLLAGADAAMYAEKERHRRGTPAPQPRTRIRGSRSG